MEDNYMDYYGTTEIYANESEILTDLCPATPSLPFSQYYLPVLYILIFFAGVSGNAFVVLVMCTKHKRGRLVDTFIINLAFADLIFVLTLPLWAVSAAQNHHWIFGNDLCKLSSYIIAVNRFSNIFFLTCMGVDRYLAVVHMLDSYYLRNSKCIKTTCVVVWAFSFMFSIPSLVFRNVVHYDDLAFCMEDENSTLFQALSLATFFLTFVLPVLIIFFCYCTILNRLRRQTGMGGTHTEARCRHSVKMVFTIVAAFVISWLPFNFFKSFLVISQLQAAELSCKTQSFLIRGLILSSCLAFLNSCANPAIYIFLDHSFKRRVKALCQRCMDERNRHILATTSSTSFSDSAKFYFTRSRSRSVSKSSHQDTKIGNTNVFVEN